MFLSTSPSSTNLLSDCLSMAVATLELYSSTLDFVLLSEEAPCAVDVVISIATIESSIIIFLFMISNMNESNC